MRFGQSPNERNARELAETRGAQKFFALVVARVVVGIVANAIGHFYAGFCGVFVDFPRADARDLFRVVREITIRVERFERGANHANERAERFGMRRPFAAFSKCVFATKRGRERTQRATRGAHAHPRGFLIDAVRIDARSFEQILDSVLAFLRAKTKHVRLQQRCSKLFFAALQVGARADRASFRHSRSVAF